MYGAIQLAAATVFGSRWFDRGDAFEVYSTLIGHLAVLGRRRDGKLVLRNPLNGLDNLAPAPGLVATVAVLLGSTAYDGFSSSPLWTRFQQQVAIGQTATATLGLVATVLAVAATYTAAVRLTAILGHPKERRAHLPAAFAHSVIPVAVGYLVAHYFSLFVFEGQRTLILASDPMVTGADLFGTAGHPTDYLLVPASTIAILQVAAVVAGHLVGVIAAHDRANPYCAAANPHRAVTHARPHGHLHTGRPHAAPRPLTRIRRAEPPGPLDCGLGRGDEVGRSGRDRAGGAPEHLGDATRSDRSGGRSEGLSLERPRGHAQPVQHRTRSAVEVRRRPLAPQPDLRRASLDGGQHHPADPCVRFVELPVDGDGLWPRATNR